MNLNGMNIRVFETEELVDEAAAGLIRGLVVLNPRAVLGLATGSTPLGIYRRLIRDCKAGLISFRHVTTFNLDEYVGLAPDHPASYHAFMREHLFDHVDLPSDASHLPDGAADDLEAECRRYEALLAEKGPIDLQILGIGNNGHIAFNEPARELAFGVHVVELAEATRQANARFFDDPRDVPKRALTMGVGNILKARTILLVAKGRSKAEAVRRALKGPVTTECPASLLQLHPRVVIMLDKEAGALL